MICTSIQNKDAEQIRQALPGLEMAEIRLDRCKLSYEEIDNLFSQTDIPLIATCRLSEDPEAPELLERAIVAGARYADLEIEAPAYVGKRIRQACRGNGTVLIRSWHCPEENPSVETLLQKMETCRMYGGEIVKIVTPSARSRGAVASLYNHAPEGTLVAFCMGEDGQDSRLEAIRLGAPFTYACLPGEPSAPGQMETKAAASAIYGDFHFIDASGLRVGASKSFAQRAAIFAAIAQGESRLEAYTPCGDNDAALDAARAMGAGVSVDGDSVIIKGIGATPGCLMGLEEIDAGESGLLARLLVPLMAQLSDGGTRITGRGSLLKRPLSDAHDIMAAYGVRLYPESGEPDSRRTDCRLPLKVVGPVIPGRADVPGRGGSQLISGLLAALPLSAGKSTLYVHEPKSIPYLFITQDILGKFGIKTGSEMEGDDDFLKTQDWNYCTGITFKIPGGQRFHAANLEIEADWSGAAPLLAAGAIFGSVEVEGLDTRSLQADISILDILMDAGAGISQLDGDTPWKGPVHVYRSPLNSFDTDLSNCPDLFPTVCVLAAFCPGESHIAGASRLRHKETDRASAICTTLQKMGVDVSLEDDVISVRGMSLPRRLATGNMLRGGEFSSFGDHRMAMALRLASLGAESPVAIDNPDCVNKSFPNFNRIFDEL